MSASAPKPEYPRPDLDRSTRWLTLNGSWDFDSENSTTTIVVPFAWETPASGIGRTWLEHARYARTVTVPKSWAGSRVFLCFGAVAHHASVAINGAEIGTHDGGYTSFEFDVTDALQPGIEGALTVQVHAPSDKRSIPHGKQRSLPRDDYDGVSFTPTSGIWQSVWLEARGRTYAANVTVRGDSLTHFEIAVQLAGDAPVGTAVTVQSLGAPNERIDLVADAAGLATGRLLIATPHLWSPDDPHLYRLELTVAADDHVIATAGLRSIEARPEGLYLNGDRFYMRGVLDQGYWPNSGITAPDDAALVLDLELARAAGYNLVRKHLKFEEPRWLHWADQMGILVWAEPACPSRFSPEAMAGFEAQIADMVRRDGNHPSIVIWGLYNEEWGLDWDIPGDPAKAAAAISAYDTLAAIDHTRPIVENSGWAHVKTDLLDWHYYDEKPASWAENVAALASGQRSDFPVPLGPDYIVNKSIYADNRLATSGAPNINSEYGGGFTSLERGWHMRWQTQELRRHDRIVGYVYTELADVEHESAGFLTADRRPKDFGGLNPADANSQTVLILDVVPQEAGTDIPMPTEVLSVGVHVSHHGKAALAGRIRAAWVSAGNPFSDTLPTADAESALIKALPFEVTEAVHLRLEPPSSTASSRLQIWLVDEPGATQARTFLDAGPVEARARTSQAT